jgi:hypothetical protein
MYIDASFFVAEWLTVVPSVQHQHYQCRRMDPILTRRAIRETPKPGSSAVRKAIPLSLPTLLTSFSVATVEPELIEEPPRINLDDAL